MELRILLRLLEVSPLLAFVDSGDQRPAEEKTPEQEADEPQALSIDYDALADRMPRYRARLFRFFKDRDRATFQEILDGVYDGEYREWKTITTLVNRMKNDLVTVDPKCPLKFRTSAVELMVTKEVTRL